MPAEKTVKAAQKAPARKKAARDDTLECAVCGFSVTVDEGCGCVEAHEIICCGKPMKAKPKAKAKAAK